MERIERRTPTEVAERPLEAWNASEIVESHGDVLDALALALPSDVLGALADELEVEWLDVAVGSPRTPCVPTCEVLDDGLDGSRTIAKRSRTEPLVPDVPPASPRPRRRRRPREA